MPFCNEPQVNLGLIALENSMTVGYRKGELEGVWALFAKIAGPFVNMIPYEDQEDFLHDTLIEMAKVKAKYEAKGKPLTEAGLMRVASYELRGYFDKRRYRLFGLNCTHCTPEERRECHMTREPSQCPKGKARQILSLNELIRDGDGNKPTEFQELIADNRAWDIDARLDARRELKSLPGQVVRIGYKKYSGYRLTREERDYLLAYRKGLAVTPCAKPLQQEVLRSKALG